VTTEDIAELLTIRGDYHHLRKLSWTEDLAVESAGLWTRQRVFGQWNWIVEACPLFQDTETHLQRMNVNNK